jgi:hypothetical protein
VAGDPANASRHAVAEALREAGQFSGEIRDINLLPGTDAVVIGSWTYNPVAQGGE